MSEPTRFPLDRTAHKIARPRTDNPIRHAREEFAMALLHASEYAATDDVVNAKLAAEYLVRALVATEATEAAS